MVIKLVCGTKPVIQSLSKYESIEAIAEVRDWTSMI